MTETTGRSFKRVHMVGGGAKSEYLCRRTAIETNLDVISGPYEATSVGNIVAQLIALKEIKNESEAMEVIKNSFIMKQIRRNDYYYAD